MEIYIVVPSLSLSGPVKGAFAIANLLCKKNSLTIIFLKSINKSGFDLELDSKIKLVFFGEYKNYILKIIKFRNFFRAKDYKKIVIFSLCFSSDIFSLLTNRKIYKISSIRGNLYKNYFYSYKWSGYLIAFFHLYIQRFFNLTLVMNKTIKKQVQKISNTKILLIRNFIDEENLKKYFRRKIDNTKIPSFIFLGDLTKRKGPLVLLKSFKKIAKYQKLMLHIVGEGPLRDTLEKYIQKSNLGNQVILHGFLSNPYEILSKSDVMVLPSYSEGTPRAAMEALFLGVPIVLRDVDSNKDLVDKEIRNGELFKNNYELADMMLKTINVSRNRKSRENLLPIEFRRTSIFKKYKKVFKVK